MAKEFNPGDIVRLKSGGPKMTVRGFIDTWNSSAELIGAGYHCEWFDDDAHLQRAIFQKDAVEIVAQEIESDADQ